MPLKPIGEYFPTQRMLSVAEDSVRKSWVEVLRPAIEEMVKDSDIPYDDMIAAFLPQVDAFLLPAIDKIDGEVG